MKLVALLSLPVLALSLLGAGTVSAQTVFTVSSWLPPTHTASMAQKEWCDLLEKNTAGKMKCNILPRGVSPAPGTLDAVKNGLADISYTVHGYTPGRFVLTQMAEMPFLGNTSEPLSIAYNRVASKYPEFAAEHQVEQLLRLRFGRFRLRGHGVRQSVGEEGSLMGARRADKAS